LQDRVFASSIQGVHKKCDDVFGHPVRNFTDRIFCSTPLEKGTQDG